MIQEINLICIRWKKEHFMKKLIAVALAIGLLFAVTGCQQSSTDNPKSYTVTFDPNGGSGTMASQSIESGTTSPLNANAFTKIGCSFAGWATTNDGAVSFADRASYTMESANVTLYAVWTAGSSYTVTFDANGGSGTMAPQTIGYGVSAPLTANAFTKTGLFFAGWATTRTGSVSFADCASYTMESANVTLYAVWTTSLCYVVTFDANGGSGRMAPQVIESGTSASLSNNLFTKAGCTFEGWSTTVTETRDYRDGASYTMGTGNVTLRAVWNDGLSYTLINDDAEWSVSFGTYTKTELIIPEYYRGRKVTAIALRGFLSRTQLTRLVLPSSITTIGEEAFYGCSGLTGALTIPSGVTSIGVGAFRDCSKLTGALTIPSGVTSIGAYAFNYCSGFTGTLTIPSGVTSIGDHAFGGCSKLTGTLTIPSGVTSIGPYAFYACSGLTGTLKIPSSVTSIGEHAFRGCSGFTGSLTIPSSVTSIGALAFTDCSGFTGTLTIPSSVTSIGMSAFSNCSGFTGSLTIPSGVTSIEQCAFDNCSGFTGALTIPMGVTSIKAYAFRDCSKLNGSLTIPSSVTSIGAGAFNSFSGTVTINALTPPTLGDSDVFTVAKITAIKVPSASVSAYQAAYNWSVYTSLISAQ
jgi:hypothetical protein